MLWLSPFLLCWGFAPPPLCEYAKPCLHFLIPCPSVPSAVCHNEALYVSAALLLSVAENPLRYSVWHPEVL